MQRSLSQNKAIHKLFTDVATEMLAQGIERKTVVQDLDTYTCPIDAGFMKEVWRSIQFTQTGKLSTTKLEKAEIDKVYDTFNRFLGENYGIHVGFPSVDSLMLAQLDSDTMQ